MEARPLSEFYRIDAGLFYRNAFLLIKLSNLPSFTLNASQSTFEKKIMNSSFFFLLSYCYLYLNLHKSCNVLTCDILGIDLGAIT